MVAIKQNVAFYPGIDSEFDAMGDASKFGLEITKASDGTIATNDATGTWSEVMWTNPSTSGTTSGAATTGDSVITLASGNTLAVGDRFDDGAGNLYYVVASSDTEISIKGKLTADIADAEALDSVGNTGIYKVDVQLADLGEYFVSISHPDFGHTTSKYEVVERNLDETYTRIDEGFNTLGASGKFVAIN